MAKFKSTMCSSSRLLASEKTESETSFGRRDDKYYILDITRALPRDYRVSVTQWRFRRIEFVLVSINILESIARIAEKTYKSLDDSRRL